MLKRFSWFCFLALACFLPFGIAQGAENEGFSYVVGVKIKQSDANANGLTELAPVLGFHYGRWRIGTNPDMDEWLAFSSFRKEPTVAYDLFQSDRFKFVTSLRLHDLNSGEKTDLNSSGRNTVRGRLLGTYRIDESMNLGLEFTQDLLRKGDGTSLSAGLSRSFALSERSLITANVGTTWGSAIHWQTAMQNRPGGSGLRSGFGSLDVGLSYRYAFSSSLAWYVSSGASRPVGGLTNVLGSGMQYSGQVGILYFGKWTRSP